MWNPFLIFRGKIIKLFQAIEIKEEDYKQEYDNTDVVWFVNNAEEDEPPIPTYADEILLKESTAQAVGASTVDGAVNKMKIKYATMSGTTTASGNITRTLSSAVFILSAKGNYSDGYCIVSPFVKDGVVAGFHFSTVDGVTAIANKSVSVTYAYIEEV